MSRKLSEPILDNASDSGNFFSNFFNGRLLTADALKADQLANRQQRRLLGRAVGDGVVEGLDVTIVSAGGVGTQPVVAVTKGLALSRSGQVLQLHTDEQVALVRKLDAPPPAAGTFNDCEDAISTFDTLENGAYLLVVGPASGYRERVPMRSLSDAAGVNECGSRFRVEGVQFRLARLDPTAMTTLSVATRGQITALMGSTADADLSKLRNILAHVCFGTEELAAVPREPLKQSEGHSAFASYGAADFLRANDALNDCEVPLALLYWRGGTLRFADVWAARRRVRMHTDGRFAQLFAPRLASEAEAVLFQFEEHLRKLVADGPNPENFVATSFFRWLPPAGLVPLRSGAHPVGVSYDKFFQGKSFGPPIIMAGARLRTLLDASLHHPPLDLSAQEYVQLYTVTENSQAQGGADPPPPYVVFAAQALPHYSEQPRFADVCRVTGETRDAYRALIQKNAFLANATSGEALTARLTITSALHSAMNAASERQVAACRCDCVLSHERALALMKDLYDAQKNLASVMRADWGGVQLGSMPTYSTLLLNYLDVATPGTGGNKPSLKAALTAKDLKAVVYAQDMINGIAIKQSGDVPSGNVDVDFLNSDSGLTLARGVTSPFNYNFLVTNKMNRAFDVQLSAGFDPPRAAWNAGVHVLTPAGDEILAPFTLQPFNASAPGNTAAFRNVVVAVNTPPSEVDGTTGTLRLTALVPELGKSADDTVTLTIGPAPTTEPPSTVTIISQSATGAPGTAGVGVPVTFGFTYVYHTNTGATPRNFRCHLNVASGTASRYEISFENITKHTEPVTNTALVTATQKVSTPFPLTNNVNDHILVRLIPLAAPSGGTLANTLTFRVRIQAEDDPALFVESGLITVNTTH